MRRPEAHATATGNNKLTAPTAAFLVRSIVATTPDLAESLLLKLAQRVRQFSALVGEWAATPEVAEQLQQALATIGEVATSDGEGDDADDADASSIASSCVSVSDASDVFDAERHDVDVEGDADGNDSGGDDDDAEEDDNGGGDDDNDDGDDDDDDDDDSDDDDGGDDGDEDELELAMDLEVPEPESRWTFSAHQLHVGYVPQKCTYCCAELPQPCASPAAAGPSAHQQQHHHRKVIRSHGQSGVANKKKVKNKKRKKKTTKGKRTSFASQQVRYLWPQWGSVAV